MRKYDEKDALLVAFLSHPNWARMLHEDICLSNHYNEDDPESCECDGIEFEKIARKLFPELEEKLFL